MGIEDGEQTYDGTMEGVKEAARQLTDDREVRDAAVARQAADRPPPRPQTEAEIEARDNFRTTVMSEVNAAAQQAGLKLNSRAAGAALALLRQHEAEQAEQDADNEQADAFAMQAASRIGEPPAPDVNSHPHVQATLQKLAQHEAAMADARVQYETLTNQMFQAAFAGAVQEFSDLQTPADVQYLAASDPVRYGKFQQTYQTLLAAKNQLAQAGAQQAAQQQAAFHTYAAQHDQEFHNRHPELNHPAAYAAAATNAVRALQAVGISEAELLHAWRTNPLLRDHRIQDLLLEVGKQHAARESVRGNRRAPVPQVQRPGVARDRHVDYSEVQQLKQKFGDGPLNVKDAGMLLAARRRAR